MFMRYCLPLPNISKHKPNVVFGPFPNTELLSELLLAELQGLPSGGYFIPSFPCKWHLKYFSFEARMLIQEKILGWEGIFWPNLICKWSFPDWKAEIIKCLLLLHSNDSERESQISEAFPGHVCLPRYFIYLRTSVTWISHVNISSHICLDHAADTNTNEQRETNTHALNTHIDQTCENFSVPEMCWLIHLEVYC